MASFRFNFGMAALVFAAACATQETPTSPVVLSNTPAADRDKSDGDNGDDNGQGQGNGHRKIHELRDGPGVNAAKVHGGGGGTGISYHGGPVLLNGTKVAAVYWAGATIYNNGPVPGSSSNKGGAPDGSLIGYFIGHLGGSSYFNINHTYTNGSGTAIANVVNYTQYWANNVSAPSGTQIVTDNQMLTMLQSGFASGNLTYDASTLYVIFTAGQVNLGGGFGGTNFQYCGYHDNGTVSISGASKTVLYAAMPYDAAYPSSCTDGMAPNGDFGADAEVNVLGHEIEETTTDMLGTAWFDSRGYENADKCAWTFGTTSGSGTAKWNITLGAKNFMVQQNWVNAGSGGCLQKYP